MCFGGGGRSSNPNLKPAPYTPEGAASAVTKEAIPGGNLPAEDAAQGGLHGVNDPSGTIPTAPTLSTGKPATGLNVRM